MPTALKEYLIHHSEIDAAKLADAAGSTLGSLRVLASQESISANLAQRIEIASDGALKCYQLSITCKNCVYPGLVDSSPLH